MSFHLLVRMMNILTVGIITNILFTLQNNHHFFKAMCVSLTKCSMELFKIFKTIIKFFADAFHTVPIAAEMQIITAQTVSYLKFYLFFPNLILTFFSKVTLF